MAYKYVIDTNYGKDTSELFLRLQLFRSYIRELENYVGIKKQMFRNDCQDGKVFIFVKSCLNEKEICNIVNKIKSNCINC